MTVSKQKYYKVVSIFSAILLLFSTISLNANDSVDKTVDLLSATDNLNYPAAFFAQYTPRNAMDMVNNLPGFSFDRGSNERGFGGNAGNVLVDGARPTSKSGGLEGALTRISAAQVDSIVILRGGTGSGETAGQTVVANVIRIKGIEQGTWALKFRRSPDNRYLPNLEIAKSMAIANWETSFDLDIGGGSGYRTALITNFNGNNQLTNDADEIFSDSSRWIYINAEGESQFSHGKLVLNSRIGQDRYQGDTERNIFNQGLSNRSMADEFWQLKENNNLKMAELSIGLTQAIAQWRWHVISLGIVNDNNYQYNFDEQRLSSLPSASKYFSQNRLKTELIARTTLSSLTTAPFKTKFGFEIANNKLKTSANETEQGILVVVNGSDVIIEEWRGELFATFTYDMAANLTLEGGITTEFSQLSVSGAVNQQQKFYFVKPRLSSTYQVNKATTLTLKGEHRVGQLNFNDFASSTEASDNSSSLGNPDLKPDQTTEISATYDWIFSHKGSLKLNAFYQWRSDILEQIILEPSTSAADSNEATQGLGNAGTAKFWGLVAEFSLPLDYILPDALVELTYKYNDSQFYDRIISANRIIDDYTPNWTKFKFRQDFIKQKFAWGTEYWGDFFDTSFRVDEIQTFAGNKRLNVFIETTRFFDFKTQLLVTHLNTGRYSRSRYFYQQDRSGAFVGSEISHRQRGVELKLSIWGTF